VGIYLSCCVYETCVIVGQVSIRTFNEKGRKKMRKKAGSPPRVVSEIELHARTLVIAAMTRSAEPYQVPFITRPLAGDERLGMLSLSLRHVANLVHELGGEWNTANASDRAAYPVIRALFGRLVVRSVVHNSVFFAARYCGVKIRYDWSVVGLERGIHCPTCPRRCHIVEREHKVSALTTDVI
jgi:hypothetical protein